MKGGLSDKQQMFVAEYLVDFNGTQAAIRAGYSPKTANEQAARLLANASIQAAVSGLTQERSEKLEIKAEDVLRRWWEIANADPNELVQYRRGCCRYCWGIDHNYQWRNEAEYESAVASYKPKKGKEATQISNTGGYGFDGKREPMSECPYCNGEGQGHMYVTDTRLLTGPARRLFAGVKHTKDGLEVQMHDQMAALTNVAKHIGMFTDKVVFPDKNGDPQNITPIVTFFLPDNDRDKP